MLRICTVFQICTEIRSNGRPGTVAPTDRHNPWEVNLNITVDQLNQLQNHLLVDMRPMSAYQNGHIPNAVHMPEVTQCDNGLDQTRPIVVYCVHGTQSPDVVLRLRNSGYNAYSLEGGYLTWLLAHFPTSQSAVIIETGIRKKFHKPLFSKFTKAVKTYQLIEEGDRIAVCLSGGKDSMLMAKLFQELTRHRKVFFSLVFLLMDPGYTPQSRAIIEKNAALLDIPLDVFQTDIFDSVFGIEKSPCYICARMRRGHLYSRARELGCNKIALGHHFDDVIETILMGMLYGAQVQTMLPKLSSQNFAGMQLIRPMYFIRESDIIHWRNYHGLHFIQCACRFADTCDTCASDEEGVVGSKRTEIKALIQTLKAQNPNVEKNIFNSVENVNLNTLISYKKDGKVHHFLDQD